jgi:hypothetical protein
MGRKEITVTTTNRVGGQRIGKATASTPEGVAQARALLTRDVRQTDTMSVTVKNA